MEMTRNLVIDLKCNDITCKPCPKIRREEGYGGFHFFCKLFRLPLTTHTENRVSGALRADECRAAEQEYDELESRGELDSYDYGTCSCGEEY